MRLVFAGTPEPAVPSLRLLAASEHDIAAVVTRPDAPVGRKRVVTPSPVARAADELGIPVVKAWKLDDEATAQISALDAELGVIVAYGGLVREPLLSAPAQGWINLHFSLLPRWRGAAPVQHALIAGDAETGAAVFRLVPELDAGDVFDMRRYRIPSHADAGEVLADLAGLGAELLRDTVAGIEDGSATTRPQEGEVTVAPKLAGEDGRVDWSHPAEGVVDRVRGVTPEPGAFTTVAGDRVKILDVRLPSEHVSLAQGEVALRGRDVYVGTATHAILVRRVQPAGRQPMAAADWWRGQRGDVRMGT